MFNRKNTRPLSVSTILLVCFLLVLVLQTVLISVSFNFLKINKKMKQSYYSNILLKSSEKSKEIENMILNSWSNESYMRDIIDISEKFYNSFKQDSDLNLYDTAAYSMIDMMNHMQVESSFLIIDDTSYDTKNILDLKDYDISIRLRDNADIRFVTGNIDKIKSSELSIDYNYRKTPGESINRAIYKNIYELAKNRIKNKTSSQNIGFWHIDKNSTTQDIIGIYYVRPLITKNNDFYGVIAVKIPQSSISKMLDYANISNFGDSAYILSVKTSQQSTTKDTFDIINIKGPHIQQIFDKNTITLDKITNEYFDESSTIQDTHYLYTPSNYRGASVIIIPNDIRLFKNNKNSHDDSITLLTAVYEKNITYRFDELMISLIDVMFLSLVLSIIATYIISMLLTLPIKNLSYNIEKSSNEKDSISSIPKTNIIEFDSLIDVVDDLTNKLYENSKRFQNIIEQASIPMVAIEKNDDEHVISKLGAISNIFDGFFENENMNDVWSTQQYESFNEKLFKDSSLIDSMYDMEKDIQTDIYYKFWNKKDVYFKITTKRIEQNINNDNIDFLEDDLNIFTTSKTLQVIEDCTKELVEKIKISKERDFDVLTGLLNRLSFKTKVQDFIKYDSSKDKKAAMIMWDLDNLKYVNDTYGHDFGDRYIKIAADIINMISKKNKHSLVARVSGDEFFAFIEYNSSKDEIRSLVEEIRFEMIMTNLQIENRESIKIRASAGICWYPEDADNYEQLHKKSDFAMYSGKNTNKGNIYEFDKKLYEKDYILFSGKEDLNKFIDERQVKYALQPIVSAVDGSVFAYESLMRSTSESIKNVGDVLRLAKAQSKFTQIEILTFEEVFKLISLNEGNLKDKKIFINSISSTILPDNVINTLSNKYKNFINNIVIELTESEDLDESRLNNKKKIKSYFSCLLAIDDYGSGYATESWLLKISPDFVKIDMSLIRDINKDSERKKLVSNIIQYNKDKQIKTIAEGVETYDEMSTLIQLGVDYLQGYYLGKPNFDIVDISEDKKREIQVLYSLNNI